MGHSFIACGSASPVEDLGATARQSHECFFDGNLTFRTAPTGLTD